ncbi:hypothetical protein LEP1GSC013_1539 [Leptospira interrogans serovar Valbuzzi str. Duyster]|nr:hypothetical protein LEP1GSC013_1539 [Leptospira interrogans serovar Valbuzzi str. Duyster]
MQLNECLSKVSQGVVALSFFIRSIPYTKLTLIKMNSA